MKKKTLGKIYVFEVMPIVSIINLLVVIFLEISTGYAQGWYIFANMLGIHFFGLLFAIGMWLDT